MLNGFMFDICTYTAFYFVRPQRPTVRLLRGLYLILGFLRKSQHSTDLFYHPSTLSELLFRELNLRLNGENHIRAYPLDCNLIAILVSTSQESKACVLSIQLNAHDDADMERGCFQVTSLPKCSKIEVYRGATLIIAPIEPHS